MSSFGRSASFLPALIFCFSAANATAQDAAAILEKVDQNLTKVQDQTYSAVVKVLRDNTPAKSLYFTVKLKGKQMKMVKFTAPGDVRGMAVLTTADGLMYVYLPSYQRVRRVASHVRNQGFMGTDLTPEDFGSAALSVGWNATILSQDADTWVLQLKPAPGNEMSYSKLRVTVLKKYEGVSKIEYFDGQGKHIKTQERGTWKVFGPLSTPTIINVTNHQTGSKTEIEFLDCKVNTGLTDGDFSKRSIMRAD